MAAQITPLPIPPSRQDPENFSARADAFLGALPLFQTEANVLASEAEADALLAQTKASEALASANSAFASAESAAASFDNFDDRYLGAKATAPTVDNDGNPLIVGALYFNTTLNLMQVRSSSNTWINAFSPSVQAESALVTATAANTSYPIVLANNNTTGQKTFLMDNDTSGQYNPSTNTASINISGNASTVTNGVVNNGASYNISITGTAQNANTLNGFSSDPNNSANTVVRRDSNGDIFTRYFNQVSVNNENATINQIITTNGVDNSFRKSSLSHLVNSLQPSMFRKRSVTSTSFNLNFQTWTDTGLTVGEPFGGQQYILFITWSRGGASPSFFSGSSGVFGSVTGLNAPTSIFVSAALRSDFGAVVGTGSYGESVYWHIGNSQAYNFRKGGLHIYWQSGQFTGTVTAVATLIAFD